MSSSKKLPLDTRDTVHDQEADEREHYHATQRAYEKGHISKANDKKNASLGLICLLNYLIKN